MSALNPLCHILFTRPRTSVNLGLERALGVDKGLDDLANHILPGSLVVIGGKLLVERREHLAGGVHAGLVHRARRMLERLGNLHASVSGAHSVPLGTIARQFRQAREQRAAAQLDTIDCVLVTCPRARAQPPSSPQMVGAHTQAHLLPEREVGGDSDTVGHGEGEYYVVGLGV